MNVPSNLCRVANNWCPERFSQATRSIEQNWTEFCFSPLNRYEISRLHWNLTAQGTPHFVVFSEVLAAAQQEHSPPLRRRNAFPTDSSHVFICLHVLQKHAQTSPKNNWDHFRQFQQFWSNAKKHKMQPTSPNAHTYVNGTNVETHKAATT